MEVCDPGVGIMGLQRRAEVFSELFFHEPIDGALEVAVVVTWDDKPWNLRSAEGRKKFVGARKLGVVGEVAEISGDDDGIDLCVDQLLDGGLEHAHVVFFFAPEFEVQVAGQSFAEQVAQGRANAGGDVDIAQVADAYAHRRSPWVRRLGARRLDVWLGWMCGLARPRSGDDIRSCLGIVEAPESSSS